MVPTKQTFLGYEEGFYLTKQPLMLQLGPLGLQIEEDFQKQVIYLSLFVIL